MFLLLWRRACNNVDSHCWIEFDGPIDAIWTDILSSVLDGLETPPTLKVKLLLKCPHSTTPL
jgi:hypothetical protein